MIIYLYLFIPLMCRLAESSSIKGRNHKNDLVPFISSRLDTQKDNSLKIVSNEPFIIQFQMPPQEKENVHDGAKAKDKKKKRQDKKRVSKIKPLRKKIRKRRDASEAESLEEKLDQSRKLQTELQSNQNKTENLINRQEILKALNTHSKKKETKKQRLEGMKSLKDVEKPNATSSRNLHRNHPPSLADREPHVKMIYPNTPKSNSHNYSYKDLIADRERLEQKINYIKNLLSVNDTIGEDSVRVRRKSDSDKTANKIAKMFLTLSAVNGLHDKKSKCRDDDDDIWEKERRKSPSRQSSSSNEERYKVKKWIEYMKSKRSSGKTCPCLGNEYNEENDIFPLEQKLAKDYQVREFGASSEETSDSYREPPGYSRGRQSKSGPNRSNYKDDSRSKLRALANRGRRKYELPLDDLEVYRSRAKQILQNAEEILDKIKEEEEKRLSAPHAMVSRLRELTSRIQGDPRNNENDLIKIIQKNLGWVPQSKSQSSGDGNSFVENMKSFILDPYEKAKALTDESTKKLSTYLLRNLGKIDSSEEQEEGKSDQSSQVYHGQVPQTEGMLSANLAKENPEWDSLAKEREEHQNWSDTLSAILGGNNEELRKDAQDVELKQIKDQEDSLKRRMEYIIKEQEKKISEYTEKPENNENAEEGVTTIVDLMRGEQNETPKDGKQTEDSERVTQTFGSEKWDENVKKTDTKEISQDGITLKEPETVTSAGKEESGSDVTASEDQQPPGDLTIPEGYVESVRENIDVKSKDDKITDDLTLNKQDVKAVTDNGSLKKEETIMGKLKDEKNVRNVKADENQEENVKDVVMKTATESEKRKSEEEVLENPGEQEDANIKGMRDREENDVLNSKHLVLEGPERSEDEELKELTEDIQNVLKENDNRPEEITIQDITEDEGTLTKKQYDASETKDKEERLQDVSSSQESVKLQKKENTSEESKDERSLENNRSSTGVVQASKDSKEFPRKEDFSVNENSAEGLMEKEAPGNSEESFVESEKAEDSGDKIIQKAESSEERENENINVTSLEKETKREDEALKLALDEVTENEKISRNEEVKGNEEESDNRNDNQEKEMLKESFKKAKQDETDQTEFSLKATLHESDDQKSIEIPRQKSLKENEENFSATTDESSLRSENSENEKNSGEQLLKSSEKSQEENENASGEKLLEVSEKNDRNQEENEKTSAEEILKASGKSEQSQEEYEKTSTEEILKASGKSEQRQEENENESGEALLEISEKNDQNQEENEKTSAEEILKASGKSEQSQEENENESGEALLEVSEKNDQNQEENEKTSAEEILKASGKSQQSQEEYEKTSGETLLKAREQIQEEKEENEETEDNKSSFKASKPENLGNNEDTSREENSKPRETELDMKDEDEPLVRAEFAKDEEINEKNDRALRLESFEKDGEISNDSLMNTSESQEKVEAAEDERPKEENREAENEAIAESLIPTAHEVDEHAEGISSAENKKVEGSREKENLEENSREANSNDEEALEVNESPKLLMSIKEGLGEEKEMMKENQEEESDADGESTSVDEEVPLRAANPETDLEQSEESKNMEEIDENDDINVRAENIKELDNQIDDENLKGGELRSTKAESLELNEDDILEEVNSLEQKSTNDGDTLEVNLLERKNIKEGDTLEEVDSLDGANLNEDDTLEVVSSDRANLNEDELIEDESERANLSGGDAILEQKNANNEDVVEGVDQLKASRPQEEIIAGEKKNVPASEESQKSGRNQSRGSLKVPKSIGEIMRDLDGKEKEDYLSLTKLNPEKIDHIIDKIDEAEHQSKLESESADCRKECACADEMTLKSKNIGRYEIVKDFLHWVKDLHLNRVLSEA